MTQSSDISLISNVKHWCVPKKNFMKHLWFKGYLNFFRIVLGEKWVTIIISTLWSFCLPVFLFWSFWKCNRMYIFHKQIPGIVRLELHHSVKFLNVTERTGGTAGRRIIHTLYSLHYYWNNAISSYVKILRVIFLWNVLFLYLYSWMPKNKH